MNDMKIFRYEEIKNAELMALSETHDLFVVAKDKRDKTRQQIRFMYVLLKEFANEFYGDDRREVLEDLKNSLYEDFAKQTNRDFYRTKTATVTEMRLFLDWLIKLMATEYGITIALELVDKGFLSSWIYANTCARRCCVCGSANADVHHVDRVGMGKNRKNTDHTKKRVISLCRVCHGIEHQTGTLLLEKGLHGVHLSAYDFERLGIKGDYYDEKEGEENESEGN